MEITLLGRMNSFRWLGSEYLIRGDSVPSKDALSGLAATSCAPDAIIWDDVSVDYYPRQRRLRLVRVQAPPTDSLLQSQIAGDSRVAVKAERFKALKAAGHLGNEANLIAMLDWLAQNDPTKIVRVPGHYRFTGPAFERRFDAPLSPSPSHKASSIAVVLNYRDHAGVTIVCLEHLARQTLDSDLEIIIVDNQSAEGERARVDDALERLFGPRGDNPAKKVCFSHLSFNAPFNLSYQNNVAVAQSKAEVVVLLNNDCYLLDENCIQTISDWAMTPGVGSASPRMLGVGGRLVTAGVNVGVDFGTGKARIWECEFPPLSKLVRQTAANSTACAAISRDAWFEVGGMDACYFPSQYDDADLCLRMAALGRKHLYVGTVAVFHEPGTTEERKKPVIEKLMQKLLERHDPRSASATTPEYEVLQAIPLLEDDGAGVWMEFFRCFRHFIGWIKQSGDSVVGNTPLAIAWSELQRMSDSNEGIPSGSAEADDWYRDEQCKLMLQCIQVCRKYMEAVGERKSKTIEAISVVEHKLLANLAVDTNRPPQRSA